MRNYRKTQLDIKTEHSNIENDKSKRLTTICKEANVGYEDFRTLY